MCRRGYLGTALTAFRSSTSQDSTSFLKPGNLCIDFLYYMIKIHNSSNILSRAFDLYTSTIQLGTGCINIFLKGHDFGHVVKAPEGKSSTSKLHLCNQLSYIAKIYLLYNNTETMECSANYSCIGLLGS